MSDAGMLDTNSSDNVILITQLREQIESLKKQLQGKDAQLLEKDKKVVCHSQSECRGPQCTCVKGKYVQKHHSCGSWNTVR